MQRIRFACDQASGSRSAFGICIYDPNTDLILKTYEIRPNIKEPTWKRIADLIRQVKQILIAAEIQYGPLEVRAEGVIMRGLGGQTLAWVVGALIGCIPWSCNFVLVHNIVMKRNLTGSGKADKVDIGIALLKRFSHQKALIEQLIESNSEDALDAVSIAVCTETMG